jgi:hypothetical protein
MEDYKPFKIVSVLEGATTFNIDSVYDAAKDLQTLKRSAMAIYVGQIAGNEEPNPLAFPAHHPYQHALAAACPKVFMVLVMRTE